MAKLYYDYEKNCPIFCKGFCLDLDSHLKLFLLWLNMDWVLKFQEKIRIVKDVSALIYSVWLYQRKHQGLPHQKANPNLRIYVKDS